MDIVNTTSGTNVKRLYTSGGNGTGVGRSSTDLQVVDAEK